MRNSTAMALVFETLRAMARGTTTDLMVEIEEMQDDENEPTVLIPEAIETPETPAEDTPTAQPKIKRAKAKAKEKSEAKPAKQTKTKVKTKAEKKAKPAKETKPPAKAKKAKAVKPGKVKPEAEKEKETPTTGQSGPPIEGLELADLNEKATKLVDFLAANGKSTIGEMTVIFKHKGPEKANSWVRNTLRRVVCGNFVEKVDRGSYRLTPLAKRKLAKVA